MICRNLLCKRILFWKIFVLFYREKCGVLLKSLLMKTWFYSCMGNSFKFRNVQGYPKPFPCFWNNKRFFSFLLMLKRLPHQTFSVFILLYFVFKRSLFYLKNCKWRELRRVCNLRFIFYYGSTHLGENQLNRGRFLLLISTPLITICPKLLGFQY